MSPVTRRPWWPPTLQDIAQRAGVSLATASRALSAARNGVPSSVARSDEVLAVARHHGYLSRGESSMPRLLVLASDTSRTGYWLTLAGVFEAAREMQVELIPARLRVRATTCERREA